MPFTYDKNMRAAAFRNLLAAEHLDETDRRDRAGYLFGWAAECGLKALMQSVGLKESTSKDRGDPFWAHFPEIRAHIRDHDQARKIVALRKYSVGLKESTSKDRGDPFWAHFPEIRAHIRDHDQARKIVALRKYSVGSFMEYWHTSMRYSDGKAIKPEWIDRWHNDAKTVIGDL